MTDTRWFTFIEIENQKVQSLLNAVLFIADPSEKTAAHLTLGGPYTNQPELIDVRRALVGTEISVVGVRNFFNHGQNTVYLDCGSPLIEEFWDKKDYGFNPHITIYDGASREFAEKLYKRLKSQKPFFKFFIGDVFAQSSVKGQQTFDLRLEFNIEELGGLIGSDYSLSKLQREEEWRRLMLIDRIFNQLIGFSRNTTRYSSMKKLENQNIIANS